MKKFLKNIWPLNQFIDTTVNKGTIAAVGFTFRTLDNFMPVLDIFKEQGHAVQLVLFPHQSDPNSQKMARLPHEIAVNYPIAHLNCENSLPFAKLCEIIEEVTARYNPEVWLIDDILSYPSNAVKRAVQAVNKRRKLPPVIAFQHGFYQLWDCYNKNFSCDYFCCYGRSNLNYFDTGLHDRIIVAGLPKLDRLRDIEVTKEDYILFASQGADSMAPLEPQGETDIYKLLAEVRAALQLPVRIKPHPEHAVLQGDLPDGFTVLEAQADCIDAVRRANVVITTGSTLALESMVLGKPTVILPSISAKAYAGCPAAANAYNVASVIKVIDLYDSRRELVFDYLNGVAANWRTFSAAAETYRVIQKLLGND